MQRRGLSTMQMMEQLLNYLHQNPVKAGIVENAEDHLYCSTRNYCNKMDRLMEIDLLV